MGLGIPMTGKEGAWQTTTWPLPETLACPGAGLVLKGLMPNQIWSLPSRSGLLGTVVLNL